MPSVAIFSVGHSSILEYNLVILVHISLAVNCFPVSYLSELYSDSHFVHSECGNCDSVNRGLAFYWHRDAPSIAFATAREEGI